MKLISFLCLLLALIACSKKTELMVEKDHMVGIENLETQIDNIKLVDWKVGDYRAHSLHKGFTLMIKLPHLSVKQVEEIVAKSPINSWVVRVYKTTQNRGSSMLGSIFVPFVINVPSTGARRINTQEAIYVNIYYASAALSGRLENLKCPAMNHRKVISDWSLKKSEGPKRIIVSFSNILPDNPAQSGILPEIFNGELSLEGEYSAEIAFYNSETKILHSEFVGIGNSIKITGEKEKVVKDCDNFQVPPADYDQTQDKIKQFKFK